MVTTKFFKAVLLTGLVVGLLDAFAATIQYLVITNNNEDPAKVFRFIAGAVFGKEYVKTKNLYAMAQWGFVFHMTIAMLWTLFFFLFYPKLKRLIKNKYVAGIAYGVFVWCVMNLLVVPLAFGSDIGANIERIATNYKGLLTGMGILIIAIGLPISLLADRYYSKKVL